MDNSYRFWANCFVMGFVVFNHRFFLVSAENYFCFFGMILAKILICFMFYGERSTFSTGGKNNNKMFPSQLQKLAFFMILHHHADQLQTGPFKGAKKEMKSGPDVPFGSVWGWMQCVFRFPAAQLVPGAQRRSWEANL